MDPLSLVLAVVLATLEPPAAEAGPCGLSPSDRCRSPIAGDPCDRHADEAACRADPACYGLPYRGESVVACRLDERGFSVNCPTVGCTSQPPGAEDRQPAR